MKFEKPRCKKHLLLGLLALIALACPASAKPPEFLSSAKRILFLGDSITHAGHYIAHLETQLRLRNGNRAPEIINLGLSSETCSGLSEPDHPFPRPNVHERLERALDKIKPDLVVACYGMNDGIYYPFGEQRFAAYQDGINRLIEKVHDSGARLILMSPPPFDPLPLQKKEKLLPLGAEKYAWFAIYEDYDQVLARYTEWLLAQGNRVEMVIDLHSPVKSYLDKKRTTDPDFTFSSDGVHLDEAGHQVLATTILAAWGMGAPKQPPPQMLNLVEQRQRLLHDAWLSHVGHKRPDVPEGLPLEEAKRKAEKLEHAIQGLAENVQ